MGTINILIGKDKQVPILENENNSKENIKPLVPWVWNVPQHRK